MHGLVNRTGGCAVSALFFVPLLIEVDESLDQCAHQLYGDNELHSTIQLIGRGLRSATEVVVALHRPR